MYQAKSTTSTALLLASSTMFFVGVLNWSSIDWFPRMFKFGYGFTLPLSSADSAVFDVLAHQADLVIIGMIIVACALVNLAVIAIQMIAGWTGSARTGWALLFFAAFAGAGLALGYILAPCVALLALALGLLAQDGARVMRNPSIDKIPSMAGQCALIAAFAFPPCYLIAKADQVALVLMN